MRFNLDIDPNREVIHYGEKLTVLEVEKKTNDTKTFDKWMACLKLEDLSGLLNSHYETDIEDYHWMCFIGVGYYDNPAYGLRDDDIHDQECLIDDLEKLPVDTVSEAIKLWEQTEYFEWATRDTKKLEANIHCFSDFILRSLKKGIYFPPVILTTLRKVVS